jgi:hypothetical protein
MLKDTFINFTNKINNLTPKTFQRYLLLFLATVVILTLGIILYINQASIEEIKKTRRIEDMAKKASTLLTNFEKIKAEETRINEMLAKNTDFNIKSYFEQFCKEQGLTPEPNWDTKITDISDKFSEVQLQATFKGQTTDKVVKLLEVLDKQSIIYTKEVNLKNEFNKKISVELTLATIKQK